ncbi:MAG: M12 family metallopeptidase [Planctomycetaceae bacterium]
MKRRSSRTQKPETTAKRRCGLREARPRVFGPHVGPTRAAFIINSDKKWVNGTTLKYYFFSGPVSQKKAMRKAFKVWTDLGIGIRFVEVSSRDAAQIRIAFEDDGSWSYLGREILTIPKPDSTMNIGWDISTDLDTGVHEIGHTLGLPHEHQNPNSGIVWNEEEVYKSLAQPPNEWDRNKTFWNIIRKLPAGEVKGSAWDPDSIMHYPFEAGLILQPEKYTNGLTPAGGLSSKDKEWVKKFYPPLSAKIATLEPFVSQPVDAPSGGQANFSFKPKETRKYRVRTFGNLDAVTVLFEESKNAQNYIAGTDDSGEDLNGELEARLEKGKAYSVRIRVMYREPESSCAIMLW